jgi:hypothetical protein
MKLGRQRAVTPGDLRSGGMMVRPRLPSDSGNSNEKARGRFPGAGFNSCDDEDVPVICPTCQIPFAHESLTA